MPYNFSEEAKLTNRQLAGELAKLTPLTASQVNRMVPRKIDKQHLAAILNIVNSSSSRNRKLTTLSAQFSEVGDVVLRLLARFLNPR